MVRAHAANRSGRTPIVGVMHSFLRRRRHLAHVFPAAVQARVGKWSYGCAALVSPPPSKKWRRGELNPCPEGCQRKLLHAYPALSLGSQRLTGKLPAPECPRIDSRPARSLRLQESLLSATPGPAGVILKSRQSIKPPERDLRNRSRLCFCPESFTRPTRLPRHAACVSSQQSKPVRPRFVGRCRK